MIASPKRNPTGSLSPLQCLNRCLLHLDVDITTSDLFKRYSHLWGLLDVLSKIHDSVARVRGSGSATALCSTLCVALLSWGSNNPTFVLHPSPFLLVREGLAPLPKESFHRNRKDVIRQRDAIHLSRPSCSPALCPFFRLWSFAILFLFFYGRTGCAILSLVSRRRRGTYNALRTRCF